MRSKFLTFIFLILFVPTMRGISSCIETPVSLNETIFSEASGKDLSFSVYLPPCYDSRIVKGYPVIYLLHGQDMDETVWETINLPQVLKEGWTDRWLPSMIVVAVREEDALQDLYFSKFDESVIQSLIPWIDEHYNSCSAAGCRAIAGMSRGALWAADMSFRNPDIFGAAALISLPGSPFDDQTLYVLARQIKDQTQSLRILIDSGSNDAYRVKAQVFVDQLTLIGFPFTNQVHPGEHDKIFWESRLSETLVWLTSGW